MFARSAFRANTAASIIGRRGFHSTRSQLGSGFHYPEGPRSNIPFNPLTKFFFVRYWAFMATGFALPFAIAVDFSGYAVFVDFDAFGDEIIG
ncbi:cytochrome c oxidase subunit 8p [Microsporum canis CBS 113480]|uniref:Cytochrome c oxidase subunit 8, mitochondrial n=1 Tax=Arthroderma otae (strain ATCC MYA-4605 / CBS 113480) TaxID=554155 RepID=C5FF18_ARTOC|nr:cytochrome c oxidase subunit 8p [Microsporum canis CBS 113480]EEQ28312.1 cytochrome c oxidase subunit 8p [Microsporum canis CBS 113480]